MQHCCSGLHVFYRCPNSCEHDSDTIRMWVCSAAHRCGGHLPAGHPRGLLLILQEASRQEGDPTPSLCSCAECIARILPRPLPGGYQPMKVASHRFEATRVATYNNSAELWLSIGGLIRRRSLPGRRGCWTSGPGARTCCRPTWTSRTRRGEYFDSQHFVASKCQQCPSLSPTVQLPLCTLQRAESLSDNRTILHRINIALHAAVCGKAQGCRHGAKPGTGASMLTSHTGGFREPQGH